jgi:hypothetical protein
MELVKRTVITPVSENLSPITISLQRNDIGEYMVVTTQNLGKDTRVAYSSNAITAKEWYGEKIKETTTSLREMDIDFKVKEYGL